jgi:hypothetical protein
MTEEKYNEIKKLKEEIVKLEFRLSTIHNLIDSKRLEMEIKGTSTCKFNINRFIRLDDDAFIKTILNNERKTTENQLSKMREDFNNL